MHKRKVNVPNDTLQEMSADETGKATKTHYTRSNHIQPSAPSSCELTDVDIN